MQPNDKYKNLDLEFWANIKLLNQRLGYVSRQRSKPGFIIPSSQQIQQLFKQEKYNPEKLVVNDSMTDFGHLIQEYMAFRADILTNFVEPNLMNKDQAKLLFDQIRAEFSYSCPLPINKQKGEKKEYAFLTGLVNMLIDANKGTHSCDYDPKELTALTANDFPIRTFSRRLDGAFPSVKNPKSIWEIKEYYYTTTFGSRVADGVYETQLDGWEIREVKTNLNRDIKHYLIADGYYTWWNCGRSYLCRLIDSMHMGLITEVIFGKEVVTRIPQLVKEWIK